MNPLEQSKLMENDARYAEILQQEEELAAKKKLLAEDLQKKDVVPIEKIDEDLKNWKEAVLRKQKLEEIESLKRQMEHSNETSLDYRRVVPKRKSPHALTHPSFQTTEVKI